jgi:hypothetical protein
VTPDWCTTTYSATLKTEFTWTFNSEAAHTVKVLMLRVIFEINTASKTSVTAQNDLVFDCVSKLVPRYRHCYLQVTGFIFMLMICLQNSV